MNLVLASAVRNLHLFCVLFIVFGWLVPTDFLIFHIIALPAVVVHWWINNDQCYLTQLEYRLRGTPPEVTTEGGFIKSLFGKFGWAPSRQQLFYIVYGILLLSWLTSLLKSAGHF